MSFSTKPILVADHALILLLSRQVSLLRGSQLWRCPCCCAHSLWVPDQDHNGLNLSVAFAVQHVPHHACAQILMAQTSTHSWCPSVRVPGTCRRPWPKKASCLGWTMLPSMSLSFLHTFHLLGLPPTFALLSLPLLVHSRLLLYNTCILRHICIPFIIASCLANGVLTVCNFGFR